MPASGSPIGTPFGVGTPLAQSPPPDPKKLKLSRFINSGSGDYEIDPDTGHFKAMPPVRQRMLLIMKTIRGSSTVLPDLGIDVPRKLDGTFIPRVTASIRNAYRQLTEVEKVARIDGIEIERLSSGRVGVLIAYTDLTTGIPTEPIETVI